MRIPEKVKILYKEYAVKWAPELHEEGENLYGQIWYLPEQIILNADTSQHQQEATLIHEIIHGMDKMYGIGLDEKQVVELGTALYMLIRDNPEMFREEEQNEV